MVRFFATTEPLVLRLSVNVLQLDGNNKSWKFYFTKTLARSYKWNVFFTPSHRGSKSANNFTKELATNCSHNHAHRFSFHLPNSTTLTPKESLSLQRSFCSLFLLSTLGRQLPLLSSRFSALSRRFFSNDVFDVYAFLPLYLSLPLYGRINFLDSHSPSPVPSLISPQSTIVSGVRWTFSTKQRHAC